MTTRTVHLHKNGQTFLFRYTAGCEGEVVAEIMRLAEDDSSALDWLDAAKLSFRVTQMVVSECDDAACPFQDAATDPGAPKLP